ncbi:glycosyltransferase [Pseudoprevotella muciniphila]|uniref:Glycosyltransferase n=1 Tax=Pseudoprevotella muciniphila TaxID=2133944 RepID=A0A5P8E8R5_9BACT|nr:glycosyltransferase [Pseudoprevotella muciniphila]QFQ13415.1 glycosyltransferase [Pseudoprevotella muciniphila]
MFPEISVIVAIYKAELYIEKCIESLLSQSFKDFEIMLIDDGSPDKSGKICDSYAEQDPRIKVFHKENEGVAATRQFGLDKSTGKYIIHVDPDDYVDPDFLYELHHSVTENNSDMAICDIIYENGENISISKGIFEFQNGMSSLEILNNLIKIQSAGPCNKLVKASIIKDNNFKYNNELYIQEDLIFNTRLLSLDINVTYVNKGLYHYVVNSNPNSITKNTQYDKAYYKYSNDILNLILSILNGHAISKKIITSYKSHQIVNLYNARMLSWSDFTRYFFRYRKAVLASGNYPKSKGILCYLSCCGLYGLIKTINHLRK